MYQLFNDYVCCVLLPSAHRCILTSEEIICFLLMFHPSLLCSANELSTYIIVLVQEFIICPVISQLPNIPKISCVHVYIRYLCTCSVSVVSCALVGFVKNVT